MILFVIIMILIMSSITRPYRWYYGSYFTPMFLHRRFYRPMGMYHTRMCRPMNHHMHHYPGGRR